MTTRPPKIAPVVARAIKAAQLAPREEATGTLARRLAVQIDATTDPEVLATLAGRLLATLTALGMTRAATTAVLRGSEQGGAVAALDQIRAQRARLRDASNLDAPPP